MDVNYGYDVAKGGLTTQHLTFGISTEVFGRDRASLNVSRNLGGVTSGGTRADFNYGLRF